MIARRSAVMVLALVCAVAGGFALWSVPALAARGHVFEKSFGSEGTGNGEFVKPAGVAVNEALGIVYVADEGNERVQYFNASGGYEGQFDGSGTPAGSFTPTGIAVDNACHLHKPELTESTTPTCEAFDPSNGDVYVVDAAHGAIDKFSSTGAYLGRLTEASGVALSEISGVAVDPGGELWVAYKGGGFFGEDVANFDDAVANDFIAGREVNSSEGADLGPGFAVDSQDDLYVDFGGYGNKSFVMKFDSSGTLLNEGFEQEGASGQISAIAVEPASNDPYVDNIETVVRLTPEGQVLERIGAGHLSDGSGVGVNGSTETVYVADSSADTVAVFPSEAPGKPTVESQSVGNVASGSATFNAAVNPRGASSEYRFEYGRCSSSAVVSCSTSGYEAKMPVPDASIGSGWTIQDVSVHPQDLIPHTIYHLRVVVHSQLGSGESEEVVFTTQALGGELQLLDGRQWEMVSPPDKYGVQIAGIGSEGMEQASVDGDAMTYFTPLASSEPNPQGASYDSQVLSTRGPEGWSSRDIATPHAVPTGLPNQGEYLFFSEDLSSALVEPPGPFAPLQACSASGCVSESFPQATEWSAYVRHNSTCAAEVTSCYEPLLTGAKGYADVPSGTKFDRQYHTGEFMGASPDLAHVVLSSTDQLTATPTASHTEMYEWTAGQSATERLRLVSILPASEGGGPLAAGPDEGLYLGGAEEPFATGWRAMSNDGSRVFWTVGETQEGNRRLYMRDTVKEETLRIDAEQPGAPGGESPSATFVAASADGSRVFFKDRQRLTAQSGKSGNDLYECQIVQEAGKDACKLTDLTPEGSGGSAEVQNILPGTSEDGSYVYFVANGVLAPGAVRGACMYYAPTHANVTCNLYLDHAGKITFIANLAYADESDWGGTDVTFQNIGRLTARVSPNGHFLAFMSDQSLTGYDNRDAITGKPDEEVYLYDAETEKLVCASCNPTGARPVGVEMGEFTGFGHGSHTANLADVSRGSGVGDYDHETGIAANLPTGDSLRGYGEALYQPRYLSDSGRLFFNSSDALVPQDVNAQEDVYEYEPANVGSCTTGLVTYSERSGGCVDLISGGTSAQESAFMDTSETGGDVFFITSEKLAAADYDTERDVYDAHECTVQAPCTTPPVGPPPCTSGEGCKPAQSPQPLLFGTPPSQTFSGAGDVTPSESKTAVKPKAKPKPLTRAQKLERALKACARRKRKRSACVKQARSRYGKTAHKSTRSGR